MYAHLLAQFICKCTLRYQYSLFANVCLVISTLYANVHSVISSLYANVHSVISSLYANVHSVISIVYICKCMLSYQHSLYANVHSVISIVYMQMYAKLLAQFICKCTFSYQHSLYANVHSAISIVYITEHLDICKTLHPMLSLTLFIFHLTSFVGYLLDYHIYYDLVHFIMRNIPPIKMYSDLYSCLSSKFNPFILQHIKTLALQY